MSEFKVADNWECANALEQYRQTRFKKLLDREDEAFKYTMSKEYEIQTADRKKVIKQGAEKLRREAIDMRDLVKAVDTLIQRHEAVISELARIYVNMRDKVLTGDKKFPTDLMDEQVKLMEEYFNSIHEILRPCKLDEI